MPFYSDTPTFYAVMTDLFGRIMATPEMAQLLRDSRVSLRIAVTDPEAVLELDARDELPRFATGNTASNGADLSLRVAADTLHDIWMSNVRMRDAFADGKIRLETNPLRALGLLMQYQDLFRYAERLYPVVLRERRLL